MGETSEEFMDRYFEGDEFSIEEIRAAMRTEVMDGDIVPVAMGSNIQAQGVANLLSLILCASSPSPTREAVQVSTEQRVRSTRQITICKSQICICI